MTAYYAAAVHAQSSYLTDALHDYALIGLVAIAIFGIVSLVKS